MNKKSHWQRDSMHRLERKKAPIKRLIEIYEQSPKVMAENHSEHGNNDNYENEEVGQPVRTLRDYLQPTRRTTLSCMVMPASAGGDPTSLEISRTQF